MHIAADPTPKQVPFEYWPSKPQQLLSTTFPGTCILILLQAGLMARILANVINLQTPYALLLQSSCAIANGVECECGEGFIMVISKAYHHLEGSSGEAVAGAVLQGACGFS